MKPTRPPKPPRAVRHEYAGPAERAGYGTRKQSRYEHARENRDAFGHREIDEALELLRDTAAVNTWNARRAAGRKA